MNRRNFHRKGNVKQVYLQEGVLDFVHAGLDLAGLIPGFGEGADMANAALYAKEGKWLEAGLSLISMVPVIGDGVGKGGKLALFLEKLIGKGGKAAELLSKFAGAGKKLTDFLKNVKTKLSSSAITTFFKDIGTKFGNIAGVKEYIVPNLDKIKKMFKSIGGAIENVLQGLFDKPQTNQPQSNQAPRNQIGDFPTGGGTTAITENIRINRGITRQEAIEIFKGIEKELSFEYQVRGIIYEEISNYKKQLKLLVR